MATSKGTGSETPPPSNDPTDDGKNAEREAFWDEFGERMSREDGILDKWAERHRKPSGKREGNESRGFGDVLADLFFGKDD